MKAPSETKRCSRCCGVWCHAEKVPTESLASIPSVPQAIFPPSSYLSSPRSSRSSRVPVIQSPLSSPYVSPFRGLQLLYSYLPLRQLTEFTSFPSSSCPSPLLALSRLSCLAIFSLYGLMRIFLDLMCSLVSLVVLLMSFSSSSFSVFFPCSLLAVVDAEQVSSSSSAFAHQKRKFPSSCVSSSSPPPFFSSTPHHCSSRPLAWPFLPVYRSLLFPSPLPVISNLCFLSLSPVLVVSGVDAKDNRESYRLPSKNCYVCRSSYSSFACSPCEPADLRRPCVTWRSAVLYQRLHLSDVRSTHTRFRLLYPETGKWRRAFLTFQEKGTAGFLVDTFNKGKGGGDNIRMTSSSQVFSHRHVLQPLLSHTDKSAFSSSFILARYISTPLCRFSSSSPAQSRFFQDTFRKAPSLISCSSQVSSRHPGILGWQSVSCLTGFLNPSRQIKPACASPGSGHFSLSRALNAIRLRDESFSRRGRTATSLALFFFGRRREKKKEEEDAERTDGEKRLEDTLGGNERTRVLRLSESGQREKEDRTREREAAGEDGDRALAFHRVPSVPTQQHRHSVSTEERSTRAVAATEGGEQGGDRRGEGGGVFETGECEEVDRKEEPEGEGNSLGQRGGTAAVQGTSEEETGETRERETQQGSSSESSIEREDNLMEVEEGPGREDLPRKKRRIPWNLGRSWSQLVKDKISQR